MIVDDHEVVRFGLKNLLDRQSDWEVVTEASSVAEAIQQADEHQPDVVVMDIRLSDGSGIDACREIVQNHPQMKVIMLTSFAEDELLFNAISAGAVGYVLKQVGNDDLVRAIDTVARGEALLDPSITGQVLAKLRQATRVEAFAGLTDQELKVLALIAKGNTNKEIATKLHVSRDTVKYHVSQILERLQLRSRYELAQYAQQQATGTPPDEPAET